MYDNDAREFLNKPLIARVSTIDADGYPHTVPIWFDVDGNDIIFTTERGSVKVRNAQNNPKGSVSIGGDPGDGGAYLIRGEFVVEEDADRAVLKRMTYRYESGEQAEKDFVAWKELDMVTLRLKPTRVIKVFE
ncbi:MAG: PPOX class F420-dependent oxidoreductase [Chloroflexi bacterium]|nr:MAG: PPOX class F420-dependent oxidoreductase [Phototrophicales bacterium]RMF82522.1 MAG: PPOX class F420-dependent oxidoreductase [Chloroflexota bacterium]